MTWGSIKPRTPEACPRCRGSDFEHLATEHLDGARGPGASWRVVWLGCGAVWTALALSQSLRKGAPLEWFTPNAEPGAAPDTAV
ncbi:MAG TPA: hypothetical protein VGE74_15725 [Gemmata sp.]